MASGSRQTRQNNTSTVHMNARRIRNERDERSVSTKKFIEFYTYVRIDSVHTAQRIQHVTLGV